VNAAELLQSVHDEMEALVTGEDWLRMLERGRAFHSYSLNNQLLIMRQMPTATLVMGYKRWPLVGRFVKKGEHGILILAPMIYKEEDEKGKESKSVRGFKVVRVFDISQTDGEPFYEPPAPILLEGEAPDGLREFLIGAIQAEGFVLRFPGPANWDDPETRGWTSFKDGVVAIAPGLSAAQQAKTLAYELGHVIFKHSHERDRGKGEVEAESFAAVVTGFAGLDSVGYSVPYIANWSGGDIKVVTATAARVVAEGEKMIVRWREWIFERLILPESVTG
jgi:hypothetical protein